jgi:hypothetical protein
MKYHRNHKCRDVSAVGFDHIGGKGQEILSIIIDLAASNYPEMMRKCFIVRLLFPLILFLCDYLL